MISKILLWSIFVTCAAIGSAQLASNSVLEFGDEVDCSRIPPTLWCTCPKIAAKCDVTQECQSYAKASKNQPIHLTLLYESLCPGCQDFIVQQLYRQIYLKYGDFVTIELVPYGNARRNSSSTAITCQHGEEECKINKYESCAIHFMPKSLPFIYCLEMNLKNKVDLESAARKCYAKFHTTPHIYDQIIHCVNGDLGTKLQLQAAQRTENVWPDQHQWVPWMLYNNAKRTLVTNHRPDVEVLDLESVKTTCLTMNAKKTQSNIAADQKASKPPTFNKTDSKKSRPNIVEDQKVTKSLKASKATTFNKALNLRKYYIGINGLSKETTPESLREFYSQFGEIASCAILFPGELKQYGSVAFTSRESGSTFIFQLDGTEF
ncbi:gamma interferon inducible lysosomal thiol reductase (GILT) domain-containing protein [Ditylenchus destructor]|nr:gamma interferon inducible lysosomal thiol reductase (GILT) domain-containing protein [Ditylenchus destructor]